MGEKDRKTADLIYPELSYAIVGILFEVANALPPGLPEKDYQRALSMLLTDRKINFAREVYIPITLLGKLVSKYFADFVIDNKILLELKVGPTLGYAHARQTLTCLRAKNLQLGIIAYFTKNGVQCRRIVNENYKSEPSLTH